jgi:hypothetical protein
MPTRIDVVGQRLGRVTVLRDGNKKQSGRRTVDCRCECGTEFNCEPRDLLRGKTKSCGCYQRDAVSRSSARRVTHGMTGTPEYNSWIKMKARCNNIEDAKYPDYGGRGIKVCLAWDDDFERFYRDLGSKPAADFTLDRIDVNGNYEPENCRWASPKEQSRNKRSHRFVEYMGREMPLSEACELAGINYRTALYRLNTGGTWQPLPTPPAAQGK